MSYMTDRDHIAITSGDTSPTRRKFLYQDAQLLRRSLSLRVILGDTYRRIAPDSEILSMLALPLGYQHLRRRDGPAQRLGMFHHERVMSPRPVG